MNWARSSTSIPIPWVYDIHIHAYDKREYSWMLMTKARGVALRDANLSRSKKMLVAETLADWCHSLSKKEFNCMGTPNGPSLTQLGPPVCLGLLSGMQPGAMAGLSPGPYYDLYEFVRTVIAYRMAESQDPTRRTTWNRLSAINRILLFPVSSQGQARGQTADMVRRELNTFTLQHWDMHGNNVMVDPVAGKPTCFLDWEHIFTWPTILHTRHPILVQRNSGMRDAFDQRLRVLNSSLLKAPPLLDDAEIMSQQRAGDPFLPVRILTALAVSTEPDWAHGILFLQSIIEQYERNNTAWWHERTGRALAASQAPAPAPANPGTFTRITTFRWSARSR